MSRTAAGCNYQWDIAPGQLLWASDWPFTGYESSGLDYAAACGFLTNWIPEEDARRQIAQSSPADLFGFVSERAVT